MNVRDIPAVLEIGRECLLGSWSFAGYHDELSRADSKAIIAENGETIIGFIVLRLITSTGESEILNIAVKPEFQKHGIGTILLNEAMGFLKSRQIRRVWLEVRKSNLAAQSFYRRNNFNLGGQRKNFYTNPSEDALLMKLDL